MLFKMQLKRVTITHIILMSLVLHAFVISHPQDWLVFDESLFSWASRTLLEGQDRTPYQMPGIHLIGAASMSIFGDNWFSLRVPVVIFGMLVLLVFYSICVKFTSKQNSLLATTILSFDTIFFFHSQLFLRDVPMIFCGMMAFWLYLNKRYYLAALTLGLGALIKETILFFLIMIMMYHVAIRFYKLRQDLITGVLSIKQIRPTFDTTKKTTFFLMIVAGSFLLPLWAYDVIVTPIVYDPVLPVRSGGGGTENVIPYPVILVYESRGYILQNQTGIITNPIEHLSLYFSDGLLAGAYDASKRIITANYLPYFWVLPVSTDMEAGRGGIGMGYKKVQPFEEIRNGFPYKGEILGVERIGYPNLSLWPLAFWGSLAFVVYSAFKHQNKKSALLVSIGIATMYIPYLLIWILIGRVMLPYYFILTIPFISLGVVLLFDQLRNDKLRFLIKSALLAGVVAWFVWYFPVKILGEIQI